MSMKEKHDQADPVCLIFVRKKPSFSKQLTVCERREPPPRSSGWIKGRFTNEESKCSGQVAGSVFVVNEIEKRSAGQGPVPSQTQKLTRRPIAGL